MKCPCSRRDGFPLAVLRATPAMLTQTDKSALNKNVLTGLPWLTNGDSFLIYTSYGVTVGFDSVDNKRLYFSRNQAEHF